MHQFSHAVILSENLFTPDQTLYNLSKRHYKDYPFRVEPFTQE